MDEFIKGVLTAPLATLLIVAGILFLFVAVVGNISGKIEPGVKGRIASGVSISSIKWLMRCKIVLAI